MEITGSILLIGLIALTAGALIGALAYRLFAPTVKQAEQVKSELDAARDELGSYRDSVNEHFDKTAELVNDLTQNYVKVYQHLAAGAQTLGDGKRFDNLLEQQAGKVAIAVDGDPVAPVAAAGVAVVDAGLVSTASAGPAEDETPAADAGFEVAAETAEMRDEPDDDRAAAETEKAAETRGDGEVSMADAADEAQRLAESTEPVLNVDALDDALEKANRESDGDAAAVAPESKRESEVRTTTH